jgi:hypothetical protein
LGDRPIHIAHQHTRFTNRPEKSYYSITLGNLKE